MNINERLTTVRTTAVVLPGFLRAIITRPKVFAIVAGTAIAYLAVFLFVVGDLFTQSGGGYGIVVVEDPLTRLFEPGPGPFTYEAIALVNLGSVSLLFSPVNFGLGIGLATLVGLNLGAGYLALTQPKSCGIEAGTGLLAAVPALLAGSACCAPAVFLALGVTASGALLTAFIWAIPIAVLLLIGSFGYLLTKVSPAAL